MGDINIKEVIKDKDSDYNIKRYDMGNIKGIEWPIKTVDARYITKDMISKEESEYKKQESKIILEIAKYYTSQSISGLLDESDNRKIKDKFGYKDWFSEYPYVITPSFKFNPYKEFKKIDALSGYFNQYYVHSKSILFVPNVHIDKKGYETVISRTGKDYERSYEITVMKFEEYKKFVEEAYEYLNQRNNKPIFVPFSLRLSDKEIRDLTDFYLKNEYYYIWFDFQNQPTTNLPILGRIRTIREILENKGVFDKIIFYATQIRREIKSNIVDNLSPSSDILTSVIGSNIIGVNRDPQRKIKDGEKQTSQQRKEIWQHKARLLHPDTYYYEKVFTMDLPNEEKLKLCKKNINITHNTRLLNQEMVSQKDNFLKEMTIKSYISNKKMVKEYNGGAIGRKLFEKPSDKDRTLEDFI